VVKAGTSDGAHESQPLCRRATEKHHRAGGRGIVSTIGSSASYKDVLENPHRISQTVLDKALDANTAYEILSLDIADVDVGENVGAKLQTEQAETNKLIAQAHAEIVARGRRGGTGNAGPRGRDACPGGGSRSPVPLPCGGVRAGQIA